MVLQVICMSFWYNSALTFSILEQNQCTITVFMRLLAVVPTLSLDFELRRVIFGLTSIVNTDPQTLPEVVSQRLPDIV